jgi:hypothetical protein
MIKNDIIIPTVELKWQEVFAADPRMSGSEQAALPAFNASTLGSFFWYVRLRNTA